MAKTQELLGFWGQHDMVSQVKISDIENINNALKQMQKGDVRFRFVIDM